MKSISMSLLGLKLRLAAKENLGVIIIKNKEGYLTRIMYESKEGHKAGETCTFPVQRFIKFYPFLIEFLTNGNSCFIKYYKDSKNDGFYEVGICRYEYYTFYPIFVERSTDLDIAMNCLESCSLESKLRLTK